MATNCSVGEVSAPPWIAEFFHSFQHRNFDFQNVSSVFAPTIPDYQQVGMHKLEKLYFYTFLECGSISVAIASFFKCLQMSLNKMLYIFYGLH